ncbi:MAG: citrate/2-methylcitrate synthase [Halobacteriales archaeon]
MSQPQQIRRPGLENVVVGDTEITYIDGDEPELLYRGIDVRDLAENSSFEETAYLLWNGRLPTKTELDEFEARLAGHRRLSRGVQEVVEHAPEDAVPMDVLRTALSAVGVYGDVGDSDDERAVAALAKTPTILASYMRARDGEDVVQPREEHSTAESFLHMSRDEEPDAEEADVLDTVLLLHADHGLNASTFTARVVASTESDMLSALTGAIGALKGPLHGGANQDVMEMLLDIRDEGGDVESYLAGLLERGERVPGFGHRVYSEMDPRAVVLKEMSKRISEAGDVDWYSMLERIESFLDEEKDISSKGISPNVDLYSGSVYYSLGVPIDFFVPMFALGRTAGWTAQVMEQRANNRLIRPRAEYVGRRDVEYTPVDER